LKEGVHSGHASGIVPSSFRILRSLIDRIEDSKTGKMLPETECEVPAQHVKYAKEIVETLGDQIWNTYPWFEKTQRVDESLAENILARTWKPTLCVTGIGGIPNLSEAGNVLRSDTTVKLSIRLPPLVDPKPAMEAIRKRVTENVPYGAHVDFTVEKAGQGWMAPHLHPWLESAIQDSSKQFYGKPARFVGEGGSIPFMAMLGQKFPETQFLVVGVLGPESNAHGPNEFLHLDYANRLTCCVSLVLSRHAQRKTTTTESMDNSSSSSSSAKRQKLETTTLGEKDKEKEKEKDQTNSGKMDYFNHSS